MVRPGRGRWFAPRRERETPKTRILYKRVSLFSPIRSRPVWGGGGLARDFNNQNLIVHLGLGRASWQGTQGLPPPPPPPPPPFRRPLRPSCDAVFAPIPTKSGASRASGWILGSWERRRPGPASAASRSLQKIVGAIVGAASRAGREHLQGSSPPDIHHVLAQVCCVYGSSSAAFAIPRGALWQTTAAK